MIDHAKFQAQLRALPADAKIELPVADALALARDLELGAIARGVLAGTIEPHVALKALQP